MLRVAPLPLVTTYAYVNPVVAVILGAIVLGEPIDARTVVAGGVIVVAVALIVTARGRMRRPSAGARHRARPRARNRRGTRAGRWIVSGTRSEAGLDALTRSGDAAAIAAQEPRPGDEEQAGARRQDQPERPRAGVSVDQAADDQMPQPERRGTGQRDADDQHDETDRTGR